MKRFLAVLMLVVMMCGCVGLAEEGKTFDPSVLEGKDGYSYDKFEKTWEYIKANGAKNENNFGFIMLLSLSGEKKEIRTSRVSFLLLKNIDVNKKIDDVTKIAVIADDNYITISNIFNADNIGVYLIDLSEDNIEPFKMIVDAKSVSVRVYAKSVENGYEDFEMEAEQLADLKEGIELVYTYELFSPYDTGVSGEKITIESVE